MRVRLPAEMYEAVVAEAEERGVSVTKFVETAVAAKLGWARRRPGSGQNWRWETPAASFPDR